MPFWDVDFSVTGGGEWDSAGEGAVDEKLLFTRAGKGKGVLVIDEKKKWVTNREEMMQYIVGGFGSHTIFSAGQLVI